MLCGVDSGWLYAYSSSEAAGLATADLIIQVDRRDLYANVALNYLTSNPKQDDSGPGAGILIRAFGAIPTPPNEVVTESHDYATSSQFIWGCTFIHFQLTVHGPAEAYGVGNILYMSNYRPFFGDPTPCCDCGTASGNRHVGAPPKMHRDFAMVVYHAKSGAVMNTRKVRYLPDAPAPDLQAQTDEVLDDLAARGHEPEHLRSVAVNPRKLRPGHALTVDIKTGRLLSEKVNLRRAHHDKR